MASWKWLIGVCIGALLLVGGFAGVAVARFGSLELAFAYLRGERLVLLSPDVSAGDGRQGDHKTIDLPLINLSNDPVQIIGAWSDCNCLTPIAPITVKPGEVHNFQVLVYFVGDEADFTRNITIYADCLGPDGLPARIHGRLLPDA